MINHCYVKKASSILSSPSFTVYLMMMSLEMTPNSPLHKKGAVTVIYLRPLHCIAHMPADADMSLCFYVCSPIHARRRWSGDLKDHKTWWYDDSKSLWSSPQSTAECNLAWVVIIHCALLFKLQEDQPATDWNKLIRKCWRTLADTQRLWKASNQRLCGL